MSKRPSNFSIDEILAPPKKPRSGFLINQLLGNVQIGEGQPTTSTKKDAKEYVKKLNNTIEHVPKFRYIKVKTAFSIEDVPKDPEGLLAGIFQYCMDDAVADSRARGIEPTHLGCIISSPLLTGGDIPVPLRQITTDTINTILNLFNKVAQSKQQNNSTLYGEPFTVTITTVDRIGLPTKRQLKGGGRRKLAALHHRVHEQCLIKIRNPDERNYCLFYALQATMTDKTCNWPRWKFYDYLHSRLGQQGRLQQDTIQLMDQVGAPRNLNAYDAETYVPRGHKCGEKYCERCNNYHKEGQSCYIQPMVVKERKPYRIVAFDLETMQHLPVDSQHPSRRNHTVNFIAAKVACADCISNGKWQQSLTDSSECEVCGQHRTIAFCQKRFMDTPIDKQIVVDNPLGAFVDWIVHQLPQKYDTYAYSHFGGRFDMVLTFRELFKRGFNPDMLRRGNKLYEMKVKRQKNRNPNVIFRDSFNLMPCSLAALVPSFGLDVVEKPFFPHLANRPENYGKNIYPSPADYLANGMMPDKRRQFDSWFEQHQQQSFLLDESLASYCTNDTEILMSALIAFRREFFELSRRQDVNKQQHNGIDVLRESMTIAAACMRLFRTNHLPNDHLAIVPEKGYDNAQNQSLLALRFFHWYGEEHAVQVQTAHSAGGEKRVGIYSVDGWLESEQRAIEVNGCAWHACIKCFPNDNHLLPNGKTAGQVRERDAKRLEFLRSQLSRVDIFWECEIQRMLERSREMRQKFAEYVDDGPLEIRSAFTGGRTGPMNFVTRYPIGHPTVHVLNEDVIWASSADNPYPLALLKVWVVPPRKIDVPVLPVKIGERLCFPLCMKCASEYPTGGVDNDYHCEHDDNQRGWVSTCTSMELNAALEEGYRVNKVFRVLEYTQSDDRLFRPYIAEFMAEKIHASGFSDAIKGNAEMEAEFIRECEEEFGITIDAAKMVPNKGKRSLAKLCLNNLWGRFALRNFGLSQTLITDDPVILGEYLDNRSIDVTAIDELDDQHILLSYIQKKEWVEEHDCSNIVISLWTTSAARLLLLKAMQKVVRSPGCTLLYTDTDSLIFAHPTASCPLATGVHLGEFTDEYPLQEIQEFCSGGAKQYGLCLRRKDAEEELEYVLKVRGMTLNYDVLANQGLRYETFKEQVLQYAATGDYDPIIVTSDGQWMSKPKNSDAKPKTMLDDSKQPPEATKRSQGMGDDDEIICIGTKIGNMRQEAELEPKQADEQHYCWNKVYANKEKLLILETGRVMLTFDMCEECAFMNCRAADFMAPPKPKKVKTEV
uniref:DNA-directed DNA polymerase n=1 Tax=Globodera pallida TaxID=36090 RepID=A0A183C3B1_GLOPA